MKLLPLLILSVLYGCYKVESAEFLAMDGYIYYNSYPDKYTWAKAMEFCRFLGMYLVDITTFFEAIRVSKVIRFISNQRGFSGETYWTSGTNLGGGQYYWDNVGRTIYWLNWGYGEPSNYTGTCIFIGGAIAISKWRTADCTYENLFICRKEERTPLFFNLPRHTSVRRKKSRKLKHKKRRSHKKH